MSREEAEEGEEDTLASGLRMLLAKIQLNSFNLPRPGNSTGASVKGHVYGVFGFAAYMNHSCSANACHSLDGTREDPTLVVRAVRDISVGEEICISYLEVYQPRVSRQEELWEMYLFRCGCARCSDARPEAVDTELDGVKSATPIPAEKVRLFVRLNNQARAQRDSGNWDKALDFYRALVKEASGYLHSNHHWLYFARVEIARCLMRVGQRKADTEDAEADFAASVSLWNEVIPQSARVYGQIWPTTVGHEHMRVLALEQLLDRLQKRAGAAAGEGSRGSLSPPSASFSTASASASAGNSTTSISTTVTTSSPSCATSVSATTTLSSLPTLREEHACAKREYEEHHTLLRGRACSHCGMGTVRAMTCARCKAVVYCGRDCQVKAWKAGHKDKCT